MSATFTITVPWWAYSAFTAGTLGLVAAGYIIGRFDRRDALADAAIAAEFAPILDRWRDLNRQGRHTTHLLAEPTWAVVLGAWGQARPAAGYPAPPALTAAPDPRMVAPAVGHAEVAMEPLDVWEQIDAIGVALGRGHYAANVEDTGLIPVVVS